MFKVFGYSIEDLKTVLDRPNTPEREGHNLDQEFQLAFEQGGVVGLRQEMNDTIACLEAVYLMEKLGRRPTFEELLEEFTGQKTVRPEPVLEPVADAKPIKEERPYRSTFEVAKENTAKRKREAEAEAARIRSKFNDHLEPYEIEEQVDSENDYADMFADLDSAKKAFVASEIFNRKFN